MTRCPSTEPTSNLQIRCEHAPGHPPPHRNGPLLWHDPPLILVGGIEPDLTQDSEHWVDGEVRLSEDAA